MISTIPPRGSGLTGARAQAYGVLLEKTRRNITDLAERPTSSWSSDPGGDYSRWEEGFFDIGNWTSSFFTGMALIAWRETGREEYLRGVMELEPLYQKKAGERAADTMHDLGFLYSLYAVSLYKLSGEARHRELGLRAADLLASRFVPEGGYIRAWGRVDERDDEYAGLAIIDCLMNLPLLYWASEETGDGKYRDVAVRHSDMSLERFIREDGSVFHAYRFDPASGAPLGGENYCGYGVDSHWARGTAWAVYGFAIGYRRTGHERYLDASRRLARGFLSMLDGDPVPEWDFRLPDDPEQHVRDSSAAAIMACGIQELEDVGRADPAMLGAKEAILDRLCSEAYLDVDPGVRGVLKFGQSGRAGVSYTSWGDYYLMEALARENGMKIDWW